MLDAGQQSMDENIVRTSFGVAQVIMCFCEPVQIYRTMIPRPSILQTNVNRLLANFAELEIAMACTDCGGRHATSEKIGRPVGQPWV